jgi:hypothetical protein
MIPYAEPGGRLLPQMRIHIQFCAKYREHVTSGQRQSDDPVHENAKQVKTTEAAERFPAAS